MTEIRPHSFELAETDDGQWAAYSASEPFFYFEGSSRSEVLDTARRALDFYMKTPGEIRVPSEAIRPAITRARSRETVRSSEVLEAA